MMLFPDLQGVRLAQQPSFATASTKSGENSVQRYRKGARPRPYFDLNWELLTDAEATSLEDHVRVVAGAAAQFGWYHWIAEFHWIQCVIGVSTGSTSWVLPGKNTADVQVFYGSGTALTLSGSISVGTGPDGQDVATTTASAPTGSAVWCNFTGRRLFIVSFEKSNQPIERALNPDGAYSLRTRLVGAK